MKAKIISAVPVPFSPNGDIDFAAYEAQLASISPHVDSVLIAGTTGEFPALDDDERIALFGATVQIMGAERTIAHLGHASLRQVLRLAEGATDKGVNRFALLTPYYLPADAPGTLAYFRAVAERLPGCPLYAYLFPDRSGYEVSAAELGAILELPGLAGVKLSGGAAARITDYAKAVRPGQELYSGDDSTLPEIMALGGTGVVSGVSSAFPAIFAQLAEALANGEQERSDAIQADVRKIVALVGSPLSHLKAALATRTGRAWASRMSLPAIDRETASRIGELVRSYS